MYVDCLLFGRVRYQKRNGGQTNSFQHTPFPTTKSSRNAYFFNLML